MHDVLQIIKKCSILRLILSEYHVCDLISSQIDRASIEQASKMPRGGESVSESVSSASPANSDVALSAVEDVLR